METLHSSISFFFFFYLWKATGVWVNTEGWCVSQKDLPYMFSGRTSAQIFSNLFLLLVPVAPTSTANTSRLCARTYKYKQTMIHPGSLARLNRKRLWMVGCDKQYLNFTECTVTHWLCWYTFKESASTG